ncbi:hypothetical protein D3C81_1699510 [compost metagenome]
MVFWSWNTAWVILSVSSATDCKALICSFMAADTSSVPAAVCWVIAEIFSMALEILSALSSMRSLSAEKAEICSVMYWTLWTICEKICAVSTIISFCTCTTSSLIAIFSTACLMSASMLRTRPKTSLVEEVDSSASLRTS